MLDNEPMVLAVAIALFARHGFFARLPCVRDHRGGLPRSLLSRGVAGTTGIPFGLIVLLTFCGLVLRRPVRDQATTTNSRQLAQA